MPDRFVNLQSQLRAVENNVENALWALIRAVQCDRLFSNPAGVFQQLEFVDEFISFVLPLASKRIRIGALLNLGSRESIGNVASAGHVLSLMNVRAFGGEEPLLLAAKVHVGLGQGHSRY